MSLDFTYLEDITGGDQEMILEMLDLFIEDIPHIIESILESAQKKDLKKLGADAHKIKPTLQYVGFLDLYEKVKRLEELAKSGIYTNEILALSSELQREMEKNFVLLTKARDEIKASL